MTFARRFAGRVEPSVLSRLARHSLFDAIQSLSATPLSLTRGAECADDTVRACHTVKKLHPDIHLGADEEPSRRTATYDEAWAIGWAWYAVQDFDAASQSGIGLPPILTR